MGLTRNEQQLTVAARVVHVVTPVRRQHPIATLVLVLPLHPFSHSTQAETKDPIKTSVVKGHSLRHLLQLPAEEEVDVLVCDPRLGLTPHGHSVGMAPVRVVGELGVRIGRRVVYTPGQAPLIPGPS